MKKKTLIFVLIFCILATYIPQNIFPSFAGNNTIVLEDGRVIPLPPSVKKSIKIMGKTLNLNKEYLIDSTIDSVPGLDSGIAVYGSPSDVSGNSKKSGEYRYLGYDSKGNQYSNPDFPNDADSNRSPSQKNWVEPYSYRLVSRSEYYDDPYQCGEWLQSMVWVRDIERGGKLPKDFDKLYLAEHFHILSPPTEYTVGLARGWHKVGNKVGNKLWYETFVMPPLKKIEIPDEQQKDIVADFDLLKQTTEYNTTGFRDKSTAIATEIQTWQLAITNTKTHEQVKKYDSNQEGSVYDTIDKAEKELQNGLKAGKYEFYLYVDDGQGLSDVKVGNILVIQIESKKLLMIEEVPRQVEINTPFIVSAKDSIPSKGAKIIEYQHQVSIGNMNNFQDISDGGNAVNLEYTPTKEGELYFRVWGKDTNGIEGWSEIVSTSTKDNTKGYANAKIDTKTIWYEGLYEHVRNASTVEIDGKEAGVYRVSSKIGRKYSSNRWRFYDLFTSPKQKAKHDKEEWRANEGGSLRFNTVGERELNLTVKGKGGNKSIDNRTIDVRALPLAKGEIYGHKKNREIYIYNKSLFKPQDACKDSENGKIDDSKTKITITNIITGEKAISVGGKAFDKKWIKGIETNFNVIDKNEYTHKKNDITKVVFVGDHDNDQKTEKFKIEIDVEDYRGNLSHWEKNIIIDGDIKPIAKLQGMFNYILNPVTKKVLTDIEEVSISPDRDIIETSVEKKNESIQLLGDNKKIDLTIDNRVGEFNLLVKTKEKFIDFLDSQVKRFLEPEDELEDKKKYKVKIRNIAPFATFQAIKPTSVNMLTFTDVGISKNVGSQLNDLTEEMINESVKLNSIYTTFTDDDNWFVIDDKIKIPPGIYNEYKSYIEDKDKSADLQVDIVQNKYLGVSLTLVHETWDKHKSIRTNKFCLYNLETKEKVYSSIKDKYKVYWSDRISPNVKTLKIIEYKGKVYFLLSTSEGFKAYDTPYFDNKNFDIKINLQNKIQEYFVVDKDIYVLDANQYNYNTPKYYTYNLDTKTQKEISIQQYETAKLNVLQKIDTLEKAKAIDGIEEYEWITDKWDNDDKKDITRHKIYENKTKMFYYIKRKYDVWNNNIKVFKYDKEKNTVEKILIKNEIYSSNLTGDTKRIDRINITSVAVIKDEVVVTMYVKHKKKSRKDTYHVLYHYDKKGNEKNAIVLNKNSAIWSHKDIIGWNPKSSLIILQEPLFDEYHNNEFTTYNLDTKKLEKWKDVYNLQPFKNLSNKYFGGYNFNPKASVRTGFRLFDPKTFSEITIEHKPKKRHGYKSLYHSNTDDGIYALDSFNPGIIINYWDEPNDTYLYDIERKKEIYLGSDLNEIKVDGDYIYAHLRNENKIVKINRRTSERKIVNSYVWDKTEFYGKGKFNLESNPLNYIKDYWTMVDTRNESSSYYGAVQIKYARKIIDDINKLGDYPSNIAVKNILPIITNKELTLNRTTSELIIKKINEINNLRNFKNDKKIEVIFIDIGGKNSKYGSILANQTNGKYYNATSINKGIKFLGEYVKKFGKPQKSTGSIKISQNDIIQLNGITIDYEDHPIVIERYRAKNEKWGNFGNEIIKLDNNRLKFPKKGYFVLEYQSKDKPNSFDKKDYGKYSNIARLGVVVGDNVKPPKPSPPVVDITILSDEGEGIGKQFRRVDFQIDGVQGTDEIDWSTLKISFDKNDYRPTKSENNFSSKREFSRIFTDIGPHKITIELKDKKGRLATKSDGTKAEFKFYIIKDKVPIGNFKVLGNEGNNKSIRDPYTSMAEFEISNETYSSPDGDIVEVKYYFEGDTYIENPDGSFSIDSSTKTDYPLELKSKYFQLEETTKIKQVVSEKYYNGIGLNGEDLDKYRVFKTTEVVKKAIVEKKPPKISYTVAPSVIVKGSSISHNTEIEDDTVFGDYTKYAFYHNPNVFKNNTGLMQGSADSKNISNLERKTHDETLNKLDKKGIYYFYANAVDEDGMESGWEYGGQVKVVSKPIADFELYTNDKDSDGKNKEYKDNIFGKDSSILIQNKAYNEDYEDTIANHGIEHIKMEYRLVGDTEYTTIFDKDISNYPNVINALPSIGQAGKYEIKMTVTSVDGIRAIKEDIFYVVDLRLDSHIKALPDGKYDKFSEIYASQNYKIKAKVSKDSDGVVAYIPYSDEWITLDKVNEDSTNKYYEKEISTLETLSDGRYEIDVYGLYNKVNLEISEVLELKVNTPIEIKSDIKPIGPPEYVKIIEDNLDENDYIQIPAGEKINIMSEVISPVPAEFVKAYIEGESEVSMDFKDGKYTKTIEIPRTKKDKDFYELLVRARVPNGNTAENKHKIRIKTPIDLIPKMPREVVADTTATIEAETTKYVENLVVKLFEGTIYENTITLSPKIIGNKKYWSGDYPISSVIPEGKYTAKFKATTYNGKTDVKNERFVLKTLDLKDLRITHIVNHGRYDGKYPILYNDPIVPVGYKTGYMVTFRINAKGNPERVKMKIKYPGYSKELDMTKEWQNGSDSIWTLEWYSDPFTPKGTVINTEVIASKEDAILNFNNKYNFDGDFLKIIGSIEGDLQVDIELSD